jgi:hypothetical protein
LAKFEDIELIGWLKYWTQRNNEYARAGKGVMTRTRISAEEKKCRRDRNRTRLRSGRSRYQMEEQAKEMEEKVVEVRGQTDKHELTQWMWRGG